MTKRMIAKLGHPVLLDPSRPVDDPTSAAIQALIDDMIETVQAAKGVGLAAPQVFEPVRVIIARDKTKSEPLYQPLINPEFAAIGDKVAFDIEGCLSIDHLNGIVPRHENIRVKALDRHGKPVEFAASGHFARVIQHEIDHLEGVLFVMRVRDWQAVAMKSERDRLEALLESGYDRR